MYNRAPRKGLPKIGDTPDILGPNSYYLEEDKYPKNNAAPFLSGTERIIELGRRLNENFHWKDTPEHIKGGSSIRNRVPRFIYKEVDAPESSYHNPLPLPSGIKQPQRLRPPGRGKLYLCKVPRFDYVHGPSVPTKYDENGYTLHNGKLIKLPPDEYDTSLGPAFYDVPTTEPCFNTRKYKGWEWSKRLSNGPITKASSNPGPGSYNLEYNFGKIDWRYNDIREMARRCSYAPRTLDAIEMKLRRENLPGPGHYDIKSSSMRSTKWMGIKPAPFVNSTGRFCSTEKDTPPPNAYKIGSSNSRKNIPLIRSGFGINENRFKEDKAMLGPGPATYNIQWDTFNAKFNNRRNPYTSTYAPFNIAEPRKFTYIKDDYLEPGPAQYFWEPSNKEKYRVRGGIFIPKRLPTIRKPGDREDGFCGVYYVNSSAFVSKGKLLANRSELK